MLKNKLMKEIFFIFILLIKNVLQNCKISLFNPLSLKEKKKGK